MITLKPQFKRYLGLSLFVFFTMALAFKPASAAILGQMPSHGDILYITADPCTAENGRVEPNWFFSYSVNALGAVSRSCYVRYNDQIWIKGPFGAESTFPMSYFTKPNASDSPKTGGATEVRQ